jgi:hypothetical protein
MCRLIYTPPKGEGKSFFSRTPRREFLSAIGRVLQRRIWEILAFLKKLPRRFWENLAFFCLSDEEFFGDVDGYFF